MSKKRGLSLEEKRQRMLEIFFEKKEFFQLKELEKIAPKEKGITSMSVKDVLQSLVDDGLVDTDRIGTSNYFWAFPSKVANTRKQKHLQLKEKLVEVKRRHVSLEEKVVSARSERKDSGERDDLLKELEEKKSLHKKLSAELEEYKSCDPERVETLKKETRTAVESANRWTDNIFSIKSWCKNKFNIEEPAINKQFGVPEELDYVE